ncbi:MAG: hypothetical protein ACK5P5_00130 [Pseudobdellovibrionaceae bacterium]
MKKKTVDKAIKKKLPKTSASKSAVKPTHKAAVKAPKPAKGAPAKKVLKKTTVTKSKPTPKAVFAKSASAKVPLKKTGSVKAEPLKKTSEKSRVVAKPELKKPELKKPAKNATPEIVPAMDAKTSVKPAKKDDKKKLAAKKGKAKEPDADEDDFVSDDELGSSEIEEYQEELEAVEEMDSDDVEDIELLEDLTEDSNEPEEIILTDAEGRRYCRVRDCDQISAVEGYCRYHYLLLWKKIQVRKKILVDGKLEKYVEELTSRYPDKFLEMIKKDLKTEKDFLSVIAELEIDESAIENEFEDDAQSFADEIRGIGSGTEAPSMEDDEF